MKTDSITPYRVRDSGQTIAQVVARTNEQLYYGMGCDYRYGGTSKVIAGSLFDYDDLLRKLTSLPHLEIVTHLALLSEPCPADRIRLSIRHDIDSDIVTAIKQAEIERRHGVPTTWCVLHTAPYYGYFEKEVFYRHGCMGHFYHRLQDLGHEVSLHTDPLMVYQTHQMDGAQAVVAELQWLRDLGLNISGTAAHNSKPVYGAWNYEIFKGRFDGGLRDANGAAPDHVVHKGKWAPLRVLNEEELGLVYEANDVFWQRHTPVEYGATRFVNVWRWNKHLRHRKEHPEAPETIFVDQQRVINDIETMLPGRYVVLVVHPCYYGIRDHHTHSPPMRADRIVTMPNEQLGWFSYDRDEVQCCSGVSESEQTYQTINKPNECGMLDLPWPSTPPEPDELSILLLGADNIDGRTVPIPAQVQVRLADLIREHANRKVRVHKLAFEGMGVSRLWAWYERSKELLAPGIVILGIGGQSSGQNNPLVWSRETGVSHRYPSGDYLLWDQAQRRVTTIPRAAKWRAHMRDPRPSSFPGNLNSEREALLSYYGFVCDAIRADGACPLLLLEECGEASVARAGERSETSHHATRTALRKVIAGMARDLGIRLVDPYVRFEQVADRLPAHHPGEHLWNATGHRLAAESIYLELIDQGFIHVCH